MNVRIPDDVVFRDLAGEAVILNLATGTYFGLDAVGTRIWHLLAEHGSVERVVEIVLSEYDVDEARLRRDVDALTSELRDRGLVSIDAGAPPPAR
jgi:hypothetical protein